MLPSDLYIKWPMHLQSLKLLRQNFRRRTQENSILTFDVDLGVKVTQNVVQLPLHHVTYPATKFEVATSNRLGRLYIYKKIHHLICEIDLGVKVTRKVAQCPLHHVTYSVSKFEVTKSKA